MSQPERNERRTTNGLQLIRDRVRHYTSCHNGFITKDGKQITKKRHAEATPKGLVVTDIFKHNYPIATLIENPTATHNGAKETFYLYKVDPTTNTDVVLCLKDRANGSSDLTVSEGELNLFEFPFFHSLTDVPLDNRQKNRIKKLFRIELS